MKIEQICCSFEQAKKLKELGVIQDSEFFWIKEVGRDWRISNIGVSGLKRFSAFTSAEGFIETLSETEADARAKMLICLKL